MNSSGVEQVLINSEHTRELFSEEAAEALRNEDRYTKSREGVSVGVETEYFVLSSDGGCIETPEPRNSTVRGSDAAKKELGIDTIEAVTEPLKLNSLDQLFHAIEGREKRIAEEAELHGLELFRCGTQAFRSLSDLEISDDEFFRNHNNFFNSEKDAFIGDRETVNVGDAKSSGVIGAIHTNIGAEGFDDAIRKANYVYMISPYLSAVSGNARFLDSRDTGLSDLRMILWQESHDFEGEDMKVGELDSYYTDMEDYLDRIGDWPFLFEADSGVLEKAISRFWKDSRIKFMDNDLIVESRIVSTQPSVEEDVAVHGFCIGRVLYALEENEELLDIEKVNENRERAFRDGLNGKMYSPDGDLRNADTVLEEEVEKAREGLKKSDVDAGDYFKILEERIDSCQTPSDKLSEKFRSEKSEDIPDRKALLSSIRELSRVRVGNGRP